MFPAQRGYRHRVDLHGRHSFTVACALALATCAATLVLPAQAPASAAPPVEKCTHADLSVQPVVRVVQRTTYVENRMSTDCFNSTLFAFHAVWRATVANRPQEDMIWGALGSEPSIWNNPPAIVRDGDRLGTWRWRPLSGFTSSNGDVETYTLTTDKMNSPVTDVRLGSTGVARAARHGRRVTVSTVAYRYVTSKHAFGRWAGAVGAIQYQAAGSSTWTKLKAFHSGRHGRYSFTYRVKAPRAYRVVLFDTSRVWGAASAATRFR